MVTIFLGGLEGSAALLTVDVRTRFRLRLGRPGVDEEVDAELEFHLAMRKRELMARGLSETEAARAAVERFGDLTAARRQSTSK